VPRWESATAAGKAQRRKQREATRNKLSPNRRWKRPHERHARNADATESHCSDPSTALRQGVPRIPCWDSARITVRPQRQQAAACEAAETTISLQQVHHRTTIKAGIKTAGIAGIDAVDLGYGLASTDAGQPVRSREVQLRLVEGEQPESQRVSLEHLGGQLE
jgi:hypothetical protein